MLIPFYIFSHENSFLEYNSNGQKLEELKAEYQVILEADDSKYENTMAKRKRQNFYSCLFLDIPKVQKEPGKILCFYFSSIDDKIKQNEDT